MLLNEKENIFEFLNDEEIKNIAIDAIKERLKPLMSGLQNTALILPEGSYLYRARKLDANFKKTEIISKDKLIYPQNIYARLGRANREGNSMFYCSLAKEPIFFELPDLGEGNELIISFWQTNKKMVVN